MKIILFLPNFGSISSDLENTLHLYDIQKSPKNLPKSKKDEVKFTTHIFQIGLGRAGGEAMNSTFNNCVLGSSEHVPGYDDWRGCQNIKQP